MHYARFLHVIAVLLVLTFTTWNHSLALDNCLQFTGVLASGETLWQMMLKIPTFSGLYE